MLNPAVTFSGFKESGKGCFGGKEGLNEYLTWECFCASKKFDTTLPGEDSTTINAIGAAKKAHDAWRGTNLKERIQRFKTVADHFQEK